MEKNNTNVRPTGGFPPIFICDFEKKKEEVDNKIRGFSKENEKIVASLKDIMGERRKEEKLFIEL